MAAAPGYVFVSYAREDVDVVAALVRALEGRDFSFRFDRDLPAGKAWQEQLGQWLDEAGAVLVVWSAYSASSTWVIDEASRARDRLVPVTLAGMSVVPEPFQHLMTMDLGTWTSDPGDPRLDQVERALRDRLAGHPESGTSPRTPKPDRVPAAPSPVTDPDQAFAAAVSIADATARSRALIDLAQALVDTEPDYAASIIESALSAADNITDRAERSRVLADLVQVLNRIDPDRARALSEAVGSAGDAADEDQGTIAIDTTPVEGTPPSPETVFDFNADTPGLAGDVRASDDQLGIEDDVRILCQLALARSTKPPLAIGLFGDWGTGKSFFMRRMQTRIREMQQEAEASLARGSTSPYCDNVVQIPFNAWHYVDSNLWASVMTRIFESLTEGTTDKTRDYIFSQLESTQGRLTQAWSDKSDARKQIDALQKEQTALRHAQSVISGKRDEPVGPAHQDACEFEAPGR